MNSSPITTPGWYCAHVVYSGNANYTSVSDSDTATECVDFTLATPTLTTHLTCGETSQTTTPGPCTLGDPVNGVVNDVITVTGTSASGNPVANGGTVAFVLCGPTQTPTPCTTPPTGGFNCQTAITNGCAINVYFNGSSNPITTPGWYCAHVVYSGNATYASVSDSDTTTECVDFLPKPAVSCTTATLGGGGGDSTYSTCNDPTNTGGQGTVMNVSAGPVTWNGTGTTTYTSTQVDGVQPDMCPTGDSELILTITVTGGTGAALSSIPVGNVGVSDLCYTTSPSTLILLPGTSFNI